MNPILVEAINTLSSVVNTSTGLAHPLDESHAKELFIALHELGVPLKSEDVYVLATENSWNERHAKDLSELAAKIGSGKRVQVKHRRDWGRTIAKRIISELGET